MPILTLHLLRINIFTSVPVFIQELQAHPSATIIIASRPKKVLFAPTTIDTESLSKRYELLLLLQTPDGAIPSSLRSHIWYEYKATVGVPSSILNNYPELNAKLVNEAAEVQLSDAFERRGDKELDPEVYAFVKQLTKTHGDKPVTMLNLLHFHEGKEKEESYNAYGKALEPIIRKRKGEAKIVGKVVHQKSNGASSGGEDPTGSEKGKWWDQVSLVHYPSIRAFADMILDPEYEAINEKFRKPALKDTILMCTTEVGLDSERRKEKL